jgi:tetratricopeptide (TPR) repeat protein
MVSYGHGSAEDYLPSAQTSLDRAFELDPNSGNAWATQGLIHMQHEDKDSAREALLKAIENNPSHAMAHMWYAGLLDNSKDKLSWYQKAYELDPRSPVIGYNIANIYFARGDEAAAMGFFSRIVEADPHYHSAYMLAATIAHTRGRIEESIAQLKQAYELSPNNNYVVSLTDQYTTLGETDKAREWFALINTDYFPEGFLTYYEWLEINIHLAEDKIEEARKLMSAKVERVSGESSDVAIEDATVASAFLRDLDGTISFYEELDGELDKSHFNNSSRIDAAMAAAYSYGLTGRMEQRDALLDRIEVIIEEFTSENPGSFSGLWVLRSQIATLRGETTMALVHLQRAIDEGFRNSLPLTYAPVFDSIRDESTFMSIMSSLEQRRAMMREQLRMAESFDSDW